MIVAFEKNPLQDGTKRKLSEYSNDLETRIDESLNYESGGNASSGYYVKFADGTMWQYGRLNRYWRDWLAESTEVTPSPYNGALYEWDLTLPQNFVGTYSMEANGNRRVNNTGVFVTGTSGRTIFISRVESFDPTSALEVRWFAIGRWK